MTFIVPTPNRLKQAMVFALLAMQLSAGLLIEAFHSDTAIAGDGRGATLTSHGCGDRERHTPADAGHECQTCLLTAQRVTIPPEARPGVVHLPFLIAPSDPTTIRIASYRPSILIPRGPPTT